MKNPLTHLTGSLGKDLSTLFFLLALFASPLQAEGDFSGESCFALLEELCAFGPRVPGSEEAEQSRIWLESYLRHQGGFVTLQSFRQPVDPEHPLVQMYPEWVSEGMPLTNIICHLRPELSKRLLLCAHWDSRPFCDQDPDSSKRSQPVLGANDAASGVVVLLELARIFSLEEPEIGIDIVLFDGEDFGRATHLDEYLLGSRYFAEHLPYPRPTHGILLDMVGERNLQIPMEANSLTIAPSLVQHLWQLARDLGYESIFIPEVGPAIMDDHLPLIQAGIPVIDLIDFDFPEWHTHKDTPDVCCPESLEAVGRVLEAYIRDSF